MGAEYLFKTTKRAQPQRSTSGFGQRHEKWVRYSLATLLGFAALNAFGGGWYGLAGAKGVPPEWLEGSPFPDYFVPSLILFMVVGSSLLAATVAVLTRHRFDRTISFAAGAVLLVWILAQMVIIGYVSWMQPTVTAAALVIFALSWLLPSPAGK